jgi:probable HAF family extracellular repeat protein
LDVLFQICLTNTMVALVLASIAAAAGWLRLRPALVHALWVLVLAELIAPPLVRIPLGPQPADPLAGPPAAPAVARQADVRKRPAGPRQPTGEFGSWTFREDGRLWAPALTSEEHARRRQWEKQARRLAAEGKMSPPPIWDRPEQVGAQRAAQPREWFKWLATAIPPSSGRLIIAAWLGVAAQWWFRTTSQILRFRRLLRWAERAPDAVQQQARVLAPRLQLRRVPQVWFVPAPISPMLWGLASRSRLLVPEDLWRRLSADQQSALLLHELAHFRRRDHWVRLLEVAVTGLHWWNPVLWWARRALHDAEERCCDAWVNSTLPGRAREYALAIVETMDYLAEAPALDPMGGTALTTAGRLEERLKQILGGATAQPLTWPGNFALLGLTALAIGLRPGLPSPGYFRAMDLGHLGGDWVEPRRLNDRGEVIGLAAVGPGHTPRSNPTAPRDHSFRTAPNRPINPATDDLTVLVGARDDRGDVVVAWDINRSGQALIRFNAHTGPGPKDWTNRGLLVDGRRVIELDPIAGPGASTINDHGLVAGTYLRGRPRPTGGENPAIADVVGFVAAIDRPVDPDRDDLGHLGVAFDQPGESLGLSTQVTDINARGQVVGRSGPARGLEHAFRTAPERPIDPATDDLGSLVPNGTSMAVAINDIGQVIGSATVDEVTRRFQFQINPSGEFVGKSESGGQPSHHAFRTAPGRPIDPATDDLGTLGGPDSTAHGINNRGDVVGEADGADGQPHAFLYSAGRIIDLNSCIALPDGWVLRRASDINDAGQIVATAIDMRDLRRERQRGYLLTPASESVPVAALVFGAAVAGCGLAFKLGREWIVGRRRELGAGPAAPPGETVTIGD